MNQLIQQYRKDQSTIRKKLNEIAVYFPSVVSIDNLYMMTPRMLQELGETIEAKAEADKRHWDSVNGNVRKTF